jgi:hypothetical protein
VKNPLWIVVALLAACGSAPQRPSTPVDVAAQTKKEDTAFDSSAGFVGPAVSQRADRENTTWRMRAWKDKATGLVSRQLYASIYYSDGRWRFYRTANFEGGDSVNVVSIDSRPSCGRYGCTHTETVGVPISADKWALAASGRLTVRINSRAGAHTFITIPAEYARGFDAAVR